MNIIMDNIEKGYKKLKDNKYAFKPLINDYQPTQEMKNISNVVLMELQEKNWMIKTKNAWKT